MIFSFINGRAPRRRAIVAATVLAVVGCTRSGDVVGTGRTAAPTSTPGAAAGAADVIGALKLVRQEYANAVVPAGGAVADATEYAETELFAEQAESKFAALVAARSEEHTSELQSQFHLVCRLLLEKKK